MGTLRMITAKVQDTSLLDSTTSSNGTFTVDTNDFRTPDYGVLTGRAFRAYVNGTSGYAIGNIVLSPGKTSLYARCAMKFNTTTSAEIICARLYEGATLHLLVGFTPSTGVIRVFRGTTTTVLGTAASNSFQPNQWFVFELWASIADAGGRAVVRINGNASAVIDYTGDTRNTGTSGAVDQVQFGLCASAPNPTEMYLDDIMVRDDTWCGAGAIYLLLPDGEGDTTNWTASAGTVHECLDDVPAGYEDFASTDATIANTRHLVTVQNPTVTPLTITAVAAIANMRVTAAGGGQANTVIKSGAGELEGPTVALDVSGRWVATYADLNPDGNVAWTPTTLNGLQVGIESA